MKREKRPLAKRTTEFHGRIVLSTTRVCVCVCVYLCCTWRSNWTGLGGVIA